MNFKYDGRLKDKQFLQASGLCGALFKSYLPKRSTQLYKDQYGDAISVLLRGAQIRQLHIIKKHLELNYAMTATTVHS